MLRLRSSWGLLLAAAALAQAPPETASVEGSVTHSLTGALMPRAHVTLLGSGPNAKSYGALTTAEGKFSIAGIVPGAYQASADRVGFFLPAGPGGRTTVEVTLRAGDKKEDVRFRLAPLGTISGRVVDAEGEPVEAAVVTVETGPITSSVRDATDDNGRFLLTGIQPGRYRVRASVPAPLPAPPEIRTDGTAEVRYAPTYFGGATDYKSATSVAVGTGAEVGGIEIRMARVPIVRISGKVLGVPPGTRGVSLRYSQVFGSRPGSGDAKEDGTFDLWNVDPGNYFLSASWTSGGQTFRTAPVNIEVGLMNIGNVELRVIPPSDISGRIVFDDGLARPPATPNQPAQGNARRATLELRTVDPVSATPIVSDVAEDGSFHLTGVGALRYRVMLSWSSSAYVKAVTLGSTRADGNVLNLRGGAAGASVEVLVSSAFGSISGKVTGGDKPVDGARIALVRDDFVSTSDVTAARTDATGSYTIGNVRPGGYRIAVVEENDNAPASANLDDYEDILAHIDVQPRDQLTKDLKRHPPAQ